MVDGEDILFAFAVSVIILCVIGGGYIVFTSIFSEWDNTTAVVLDKYEEDISNVVYVSNGQSTYPVVSVTHEYVLVTDKGEIYIDSIEYDKYDVNTTINIEINKDNGMVRLLN